MKYNEITIILSERGEDLALLDSNKYCIYYIFYIFYTYFYKYLVHNIIRYIVQIFLFIRRQVGTHIFV